MKIRNHLAVLFFATACVAACTKNKDERPNAGTHCRISKAYLYEGTATNPFTETIVYTYTDTNLTTITGTDFHFDFAYAGGRIIRRDYVQNYGALVIRRYDIISYTNDGMVSKIDSYAQEGDTTKQGRRYDFSYASGKLATFTYTRYTAEGVASAYSDIHFYSYTNNNITKDSLVINDPDVPRSSLYYYTHDTGENLFAKNGVNTLLSSPVFMQPDGTMLPFFFSAGNVTGFGGAQAEEKTSYSYSTDSNKNLIQVNEDGKPVTGWDYQCR